MGYGLLLQNLLAMALVVLLPALWVDRSAGRPFWEIGTHRTVLLLIAGAYTLAAAFLGWRRRRASANSLGQITLAAAVSGLVVVWAVFGARLEASRAVVAFAGVLTWLVLLVLFGIAGRNRAKATVLAAVALAASATHLGYAFGGLGDRPDAPGPPVTDRQLRTSLYDLHIRTYRGFLPPPRQSAGAIARLWDDYLLATGDGRLFRFAEDEHREHLEVHPLPWRVPTNPDDFRRAVKGLGVQEDYFRVADIYTTISGNGLTLFATHHYWHNEGRCVTMRLSMVELSRADLEAPTADAGWRTVWETSPCLPVTIAPDNRPFFEGHEVGGRIAMLDDSTVLVTVGHQGFDGVTAPITYPQDPTASYGKTFTVRVRTGEARLFTLGHRNPQGLFVDPTGVVYSTEHGPEGGDELNLLEPDGNYGWPVESYGMDYGRHEWPTNPEQGRHAQFRRPLFAWAPSIGPSQLTGLTRGRFPLWRQDLLVSSLRAGSLFRMRVAEGRVVLAEQMYVGVPMRDIIEGHQGQLVIWNERVPEILFIVPETTDTSGAGLFGQCAGCHAIKDGRAHGVGPDLFGVVGRWIASRRGFVYSEGLRTLQGTWTEARLNAFLENPSRFAPGTTMRFAGLRDARQRSLIIQYLIEASVR